MTQHLFGRWEILSKVGFCGGLVEAPVWRVAVLVLALTASASAQTVTVGPVDTSMKFAWSPPANVITVADALTFEYRLRDGTFIPVTALTGVTCAGAPIACQASLSQANADALNRVGTHTLTLSAFRTDVGDSAVSLPFVLTSRGGAPTNLRIIR